MKIVVCEPQCWGFEHALFNAALLKTVLLAYPEATVFYAGEKEHLGWVETYMRRVSPAELLRVEWREITIPKPDYAHWGRFTLSGYRSESIWYRQVKELIAHTGAHFLVITSITDPGLFVIKTQMYLSTRRVPTLVVPHSILAMLLYEHPFKLIIDRMMSFRQMLMLPQPRQLRYVALGGSIHRYLRDYFPSLAGRFSILDLPYLWDNPYAAEFSPETFTEPEKICFGYIGVGHKGFDTFSYVASCVQPHRANTEFLLIGFLNTPVDPKTYQGFVEGVSETPLTPEEFARRSNSMTYAVWTARPTHYRLAASASFIDALSFCKPGIFLRSPFIEHYYHLMGDIGYLCDTVQDVVDTAWRIAHDFPLERYRQQCANILRARRIFEPETLAPLLRKIGEECGV